MPILAHPVRAVDWDSLVVPDGYQAQVISGELVVTPAPSVDHGRALARLIGSLGTVVPRDFEPVSGVEWRLDVGGVVAMAPQPDIMVIRRDVTGAAVIEPPLLAVEILSRADHDRLADGRTRREGKLADYAANGLHDYLEVDLTVMPPRVARYELIDGALVAVDHASDDQQLSATRPFAYSVVATDLVR